MELKKISKIGASFLLSASLLILPLSNVAKASDEYELENSVKAYYNSDNAKEKKNPRSVYKAGKYYIYRTYNGMVNITKTPGIAGGWIDPKDNKSLSANKLLEKLDDSKKAVGTVIKDKQEFNVKVKTFGYMNAKDAKKLKNHVNIIYPGNYYIYETYNGMINITKEKGVAGSWVNPNSKKDVKPSIPVTKTSLSLSK